MLIGGAVALLAIRGLPLLIFPLALAISGDQRAHFEWRSIDIVGLFYTIWGVAAVVAAVSLCLRARHAQTLGMVALGAGFVFSVYYKFLAFGQWQRLYFADLLPRCLEPVFFLICFVGFCWIRSSFGKDSSRDADLLTRPA